MYTRRKEGKREINAINEREKYCYKGKLHYWSLTFTQVVRLVPNV
jgi:hypothetical protein